MPQQQQQPRQNGKSNGSQPQPGPKDQLDMIEAVLNSSNSNPLVRDTNLGLGNYDDSYLWQQIRSYRKGLYASIAFSNVLTERAIHETQYRLATEGYNAVYDEDVGDVEQFPALDPEDAPDGRSSWNWLLEEGRERWERIGNAKLEFSREQVAAIMKKAGTDTEFMPVFWHMVSGRHEASRSKDAELLRDALTAVNENRTQDNGDGGILPGR